MNAQVIALVNQKGGVGKESPSSKVLATWHKCPEGLSIMQKDHVLRALSQSNKSKSLCHVGISGSGVGLG